MSSSTTNQRPLCPYRERCPNKSSTCIFFHPTKQCTSFALGSCKKGDTCTYIHDASAKPPPLCPYRERCPDKSTCASYHPIKPCIHFARGSCKNGDQCTFMHDASATPAVQPTRPCRDYEAGSCPRGTACTFAHMSSTTTQPSLHLLYPRKGATTARPAPRRTLSSVSQDSSSDDDSAPADPSNRAPKATRKPRNNKKIRCRYWKSGCTRGDQCDYAHPKRRCNNQPDCKYGDMCIFVHDGETGSAAEAILTLYVNNLQNKNDKQQRDIGGLKRETKKLDSALQNVEAMADDDAASMRTIAEMLRTEAAGFGYDIDRQSRAQMAGLASALGSAAIKADGRADAARAARQSK